MPKSINKYVNKETTSYLIFGVLTTLVNYIVFVALNMSGVNIVLNNFLSWVAAVIFAYFTNKKFVFNSTDYSPKKLLSEFGSFVTARVLSLVFETVMLVVTVKLFHMNTYVAKLLISVGVVIINYFASKLWIFKEKDPNATPKTFWQKLALIDSEEESTSSLLSGNITYVLSFILPLIVLIIVYKGRTIFPFGDECYLRSDMYHQYAPFMSELWNKLTNGESLTYTFNFGLGTNFTALSAYYLASPANWFIFLFPQKSMIEIMLTLITLKMAGMCLSFTYYLTKHFNTKSILCAVFGLFYGLSGYLAAYSWNIMWLDCLVILPLIILGLERLVKEDKYMLYTLSLGFCIFTNYYISIMVCLAVVLLFAHNLISLPKQKHAYLYFKKIFNFALFSLLAGGLACCMLIPEIYAFKLSASNDFNFPELMECYFPILEMLVRHLPNVPVHLGLEHMPNIYCGSFIFFLFPLYIFSNRQTLREKLTKIVVLVALLTSFNLNIPNYIWHGLHFPNSLPARQSFIYIFVLLTMCFEAALNIKDYTKEQLLKAFGIAIAFLLIAEQCYTSEGLAEYSFKSMYIAGIFIFLYLIIALIHNYSKLTKYICIVLIIVIPSMECGMNMDETAFGTTSRSGYLANYDAVENIKNFLAETDDSFYRTEFYNGYRSNNDTAWHNLKGVSTFSSTASAGMTAFMNILGCENSYNAYTSHGLTALTSAMLNVKYMISTYSRTEGTDLSFAASYDGYYLYQNNYTLPIAYLVDPNLNTNWYTDSGNPFDVQNDFICNTTGISDTFFELDTYYEDGNLVTFLLEKKHVYIYIPHKTEGEIIVSAGDCINTYDLHDKQIIDIGYFEGETPIYITDAPGGTRVYSYDEDTFLTAFNSLNSGSLNVTSFSDTNITGTLNASYNGSVLCSIPYEEGWSVYVDGQKVKTYAMKDALLAFDVSAGQHDIVIKYHPAGLTAGIILSVSSAIILLAIFVFDTRNKKKTSKKGNVKQ